MAEIVHHGTMIPLLIEAIYDLEELVAGEDEEGERSSELSASMTKL